MKNNIIISLLISIIPLFLAYGMNEDEAYNKAVRESLEEAQWDADLEKALLESAQEEADRQAKIEAEEKSKEDSRKTLIEQTASLSLSDKEQERLLLDISKDEYGEKKESTITTQSGEWHEQGLRQSMEDDSVNQVDKGIWAIFDGHGGNQVAKYAATHLIDVLNNVDGNSEKKLTQGLKNLNENVIKHVACEMTGSCAIVAFLNGRKLSIANLGDSRAILSRKGIAIPLSIDHNGDNPEEKARIEKAGQRTFGKGLMIDSGIKLAVTRALGDTGFIDAGLCADAEIQSTEIQPQDEFLLLACDGIFEQINNQEAITIVADALKKHKGKENAEMLAAKDLVLTALTGYNDEVAQAEAVKMLEDSIKKYPDMPLQHRAYLSIPRELKIGENTIKQRYPSSTDNLSAIVVTFKS